MCARVFPTPLGPSAPLTTQPLCMCRIHYPLPLPYLGKPDPAVLQKEVRALKAELSAVTSHGVNKSADAEIQRLRTELVALNSHECSDFFYS